MGLTRDSSSAIVPSKGSTKWMVWGGMTGRGLTSLHFIPQGQTVTAEYCITKILQKEVKPLFSRRSTKEEPVKRNLFTNKSSATFDPDGAPAHAAKATQHWCKKNLPNLSKTMSGQQIYLILPPLKTYGVSSTKLHTEIRSLRRWED